MKNKKILIGSIVLLLIIGLAFVGYKGLTFVMDKYHYIRNTIDRIEDYEIRNSKTYDFNYDWINDNVLVAHAFGGKGTKTYTNSLQAFEYNYELGHRIFEVDFDLTTDNKTICSHDEEFWRYITNNEDNDSKYDYETFKSTPLFTDYTPLDYMDIINLLNEYPDIIIITDTKYSDETSVYKQFSQLVDYAKDVNPEVLDRLVPQIYTKEMLDYVMNVHEFKSIIFTLYQTAWEADDIARFCIRNGIKYMTVSTDQIDDETIDLWNSMNINIAVHTVNEYDEASDLLARGVRMIYTDFLEPKEMDVNQ